MSEQITLTVMVTAHGDDPVVRVVEQVDRVLTDLEIDGYIDGFEMTPGLYEVVEAANAAIADRQLADRMAERFEREDRWISSTLSLARALHSTESAVRRAAASEPDRFQTNLLPSGLPAVRYLGR